MNAAFDAQNAAPLSSTVTATSKLDLQRVVFWGAMALAACAAGVALAIGPRVGLTGAALLFGLGAVALVLLLWLSRGRGRLIGIFPGRGAADAFGLYNLNAELALLDAIEEPALVTDRTGGVVAANTAYLALARHAGAMADSERPAAMDRLFGADPALSAPMYRLARAAQSGLARRENLPPAVLRPGEDPQRLEALVAPAPHGRALWRLRAAAARIATPETNVEPGLFVDDAPIGFLAAKADGAVVYMNQTLRALLGLSLDLEAVWLKDIFKEDPSRLLRRDRRGASAHRAEATLRPRDGAEIPAHLHYAWPPGETTCRVFVLPLDQEAPATSTSLAPRPALTGVEAFFEHAPFGAAILDGGDPALATILDANPTLMEMAQGRATPGAAFVDLFEAAEGPQALAARLRRAASGASIDVQIAGDPPSAAHVHFSRLSDGRGLAYVINVSEQRELEQRLAQSEKMREIGLLAGGVAHDFNNLLTVMMQITDYLLLRHPVGDPDYVDLNHINIHALRAKELSEMLRAYARQQTFKVEIVEVAGFMQQMHEIGRRLSGDSIKVEIQHAANLPFVRVDKTQLERVLVNLMSNARDAIIPKEGTLPRGGGAITMKTSRANAADMRKYASSVPIEDGEYVEISVSDTGAGIPQAEQHKIFHPFHSTKEPNKGTGLGLATCYGIVKQSGGYIFFDSKVGHGTTFRVFLPAYAPSSEELEEMSRRERARVERKPVDLSGRGRILFVEDDDDVRRATARNLENLGFEIVCAEDGEEALRILKEEAGTFHLIISDVSMPIMNGPEMLRAAGAKLIGSAKVLLLSGYAVDSVAKQIEDIPVSFLSKPVGASTLAQRVKELLAA